MLVSGPTVVVGCDMVTLCLLAFEIWMQLAFLFFILLFPSPLPFSFVDGYLNLDMVSTHIVTVFCTFVMGLMLQGMRALHTFRYGNEYSFGCKFFLEHNKFWFGFRFWATPTCSGVIPGSELKDHSLWCWGTITSARAQTWVGCLQDKNTTHCTILALNTIFLVKGHIFGVCTLYQGVWEITHFALVLGILTVAPWDNTLCMGC